MNDKEIARGLGWASIGIGLTEIAAPHQLERLMGIGDGQNTGILRTMGVREIMSGVDILTHDDPTPGVWARVAGDALDGVLLGVAATKTRRPGSFAALTAMVLGIVALDVVCACRLSSSSKSRRRWW
ncbi:MAG: transcriptional regulator [Phycisphaerales bacterium]|nr:transcriptional regulator [Phycisphaerales bacterium]